ncbi:MAG: hypothetical protein H7Y27_03600 [Gemmatimonadaceae bacterium]|nr:hypothetical protein [Chitinophagaceae bacterium]
MYKRIIDLRSRLLVYLTHHLALPVLRIIRKPQVFPYSKKQLLHFPPGTLGRDLVEMLEQNEFELLTHYAKHDMKHIILGYPTTDEGEVSLQAFMLGNRHLSFPVISTILYGIATMPEYWKAFYKAYRRGRKSATISHWQWFEIVHQPTHLLRQNLQNK